jgi:PKD repeat protein
MKNILLKITQASIVLAVTVNIGLSQSNQLSLLPGDNPTTGSAGLQITPEISASDNMIGGVKTLVVWADSRANPYGSFDYESAWDIYGVRLDANGNPIESQPFPIYSGHATQNNPKVAWNGTQWLVVFESYDLSGTGFYYAKTLQAVRVSQFGQVLDPKPITLFGLTPSGPSYWDVASDGRNFVVVNQGTSTSGDIVAMRVSYDGYVLDSPTKAMVDETYFGRYNIKLVYARGAFLLSYYDNNDSKAIRFDSDLNKLDTQPFSFLPVTVSDFASTRTAHYVVWSEQQWNYTMAIKGSRVAANGIKLDGNGVNISGSFPADPYTPVTVVWDGQNWKAVWQSNGSLRIARISTFGQVLDPGGVLVPGPKSGVSAGNGKGGVHVVWNEYVNSENDILGAHIDVNNNAQPNQNLSVSAPQQVRSDIAASGNGYMVVYRSSVSQTNRVMAQPLDIDGNPLTSEPILLATGGLINGPGIPNVAWNGSVYLVAWSNSNVIVAQRLLPDGTKVDQSPFVVMSQCFGPSDVAALGEKFFITGRKFGSTTQYILATGARVDGNTGQVLDGSPLVLGGIYVRTMPAVTTLGGKWLVVFSSNWTHDNPNADTIGVFVPPSGSNENAFAIHGPFSTSGGNFIFEIGLASSGNVALMVQSQELTSGVETDLLARRVFPNGTVSSMVNLTPWIGNQYRPRVSWDGKHFIVVYQEQKNRDAPHTLDQLDARSDLFAMRITESGSILDTQGFVFSAESFSETDPNVVSLNGKSMLTGSLLLRKSLYDNTLLNNYRVVYQVLDSSMNLWPVAIVNHNPKSGDVPLTVNFNASSSYDPDGSIASYEWDFGDGSTTTEQNPTHVYSVANNYIVKLTVTDNNGAKTQQAVLVKATNANIPPVAVAWADKTSGTAPLNVVFKAKGSYDPDGLIGNIKWTFPGGGTYWGSTAYNTFNSPGVYDVLLTVYDSRGASDTTVIQVTVTN